MLSDLEIKAQKLSGKGNWFPWAFERIVNGVLCTGAVCPPITRGKRIAQLERENEGLRERIAEIDSALREVQDTIYQGAPNR